jgi:hypothetical protein
VPVCIPGPIRRPGATLRWRLRNYKNHFWFQEGGENFSVLIWIALPGRQSRAGRDALTALPFAVRLFCRPGRKRRGQAEPEHASIAGALRLSGPYGKTLAIRDRLLVEAEARAECGLCLGSRQIATLLHPKTPRRRAGGKDGYQRPNAAKATFMPRWPSRRSPARFDTSSVFSPWDPARYSVGGTGGVALRSWDMAVTI